MISNSSLCCEAACAALSKCSRWRVGDNVRTPKAQPKNMCIMFASAAYPVREVGMAASLTIRVNDELHEITADPDTPLLYVLINDLALNGPRFGCGLAQCGSCSVLADGVEIRSCVTPVARIAGKSVTTFEGLAAWYAERNQLAQAPALHPLQQAFIDEQAPQCGYCYNGMLIKGA